MHPPNLQYIPSIIGGVVSTLRDPMLKELDLSKSIGYSPETCKCQIKHTIINVAVLWKYKFLGILAKTANIYYVQYTNMTPCRQLF